MSSLKVLLRRPHPDSIRSTISIQRPRPVQPSSSPHPDEEPTLAERVFLFLDERSA